MGMGVDNARYYQSPGAFQYLFGAKILCLIRRADNANLPLVNSNGGMIEQTPSLVHGDNGCIVDENIEFHILHVKKMVSVASILTK
jgi:hypothetical protein